MSSKWRKALLALIPLAALLAFASYWGISTYKRNVRIMEVIKGASIDPNGLDPQRFVASIDVNFKNLPVDEQRRLASDPKLLSERIEKAAYDNYKQAFGELFLLPKPLRTKVIQNAIDTILNAGAQDPALVDAYYDSEAGKATLRAAAKYFVYELSGSEKAELKPLTEAFFKIHVDRIKRGKK